MPSAAAPVIAAPALASANTAPAETTRFRSSARRPPTRGTALVEVAATPIVERDDNAASASFPCHHRRMRKAPTFAVIAVALFAGLAIAQRAAQKRPTLHEDLPPETNTQSSPTIGDYG